MIEKELNIPTSPPEEGEEEVFISGDDILEFLMKVFHQEEEHEKQMLKEQYDMDAAQYGGILTLGQFQILSQFSSRKLDNRIYTKIMCDAMRTSREKTISFEALVDHLHRNDLLIPFCFDRLEYSLDTHPVDRFQLFEEEFTFHHPEFEIILEKAKSTDDALYNKLTTTIIKVRQALKNKSGGVVAEAAQRELYELLMYSIHD
ncbi:hypothetical protein IKN40_03785 [bacterium]|nr:hypothetical protein [bacterium]